MAPNPINPYWPRYVFKLLLSRILEYEIDLARGILLNARGHADPTGLGQSFEPGRDIHPVPKNVSVLDHHVADVETHSELDAFVLRHWGVPVSQAPLDRSGGAQRVDNTTDLNEEPFARRFDQPAAMRDDRRVDHLGADGP